MSDMFVFSGLPDTSYLKHVQNQFVPHCRFDSCLHFKEFANTMSAFPRIDAVNNTVFIFRSI